MIHNPMPGMNVRYTGEKLLKKYPDEVKNKVGEIVAKIAGSQSVVVEFGNNSFIVDPSNLTEHFFKDKVEAGPEITRILRKWNVDSDGGK